MGSNEVITKLPNSEQSCKGKVKTRKYINRQNQSTTGKLKTVMTLTWQLVQAFLKKWWVESDFKAPNPPLSLRLRGSGCHTCSSSSNKGHPSVVPSIIKLVIQYSQRNSVINHCDRRITILSDTIYLLVCLIYLLILYSGYTD